MQPNLITLQEAINQVKAMIEGAITIGGTEAKNNLIRSQQPIKLLHEVVKSELIRYGVDRNSIKPSLGSSAGELKLAGFFKQKDQDICVLPSAARPCAETLKFEGDIIWQKGSFWTKLH